MQFPMGQMNPHAVGFPQQNPQIAEMQRQINFLQQYTQMQSSQMAQMHQQMSHEGMYGQPEFSQMQASQFQGSYFPKGKPQYNAMYANEYHQGIQPDDEGDYEDQEEYYDEDNQLEEQYLSQHSQQEVNEFQEDTIEQEMKKGKNSKRTPIKAAKQTSNKATPSKQATPGKHEASGAKRANDTPNRRKHSQADDDLQEVDKIAPNPKVRDHSDSRNKTGRSQSPKDLTQTATRLAKKGKAQDLHDNRNIIDDGSNVRRTTRSMLNKAPTRRRLA